MLQVWDANLWAVRLYEHNMSMGIVCTVGLSALFV